MQPWNCECYAAAGVIEERKTSTSSGDARVLTCRSMFTLPIANPSFAVALAAAMRACSRARVSLVVFYLLKRCIWQLEPDPEDPNAFKMPTTFNEFR
jgi:hypothetical protein